MNVIASKVDNGVNVEALLGARAALTEAPEAARFKWRAVCDWVRGTHSRSTVEGFFGLGAEHSRGKSFRFDADHPELFASEDNGATLAMPAVRHEASATSTYSTGVAPLSAAANSSGWSAS